jgi:ABC-2 type transport system permease protein
MLRLVLLHARAITIELLRYPAFLVPTLAFPAVFFLFFLGPRTQAEANLRMGTFSGFAVIGVAFFQFGVGIAVERASPWETYLRTLPIGPGARLGARVLSAVAFAGAAAAILVAVAVVTTDAALAVSQWVALVATLLLGAVPFAVLGIALGYWAPQRGALPIANLLYLGLSYAGGLWFRARELPTPVEAVSPYLPTRAFADALAASVEGRLAPVRTGASLVGFTALFALLAAWGYRRDEGTHFR